MRPKSAIEREFRPALDSGDDALFDAVVKEFEDAEIFERIKAKEISEVTLEDVFALMGIEDPDVSNYIDHIFRAYPELYEKFRSALEITEKQEERKEGLARMSQQIGQLGVAPISVDHL